ncbi:MAG: C69 family dipeptidase [Gemmatimonadales bacterium]|nr:C69 family dipeptidase [Gemmatimonadales bacterium]
MKLRILLVLIIVASASLTAIPTVQSCTSILISKGASADGSVMITYSADSGGSLAHLFHLPAADHEVGELVDPLNWEQRYSGCKVKQVAHTYSVFNLMNEHQLTIGETTFGGREELHNEHVGLNYAELISLALQRFKTAREAVLGMADLVREYGYSDGGETFSVADKNEVWMMEIIGKGPDQKGAVWVACRIPDGYMSAHANLSRISNFPQDDSDNWLFAPDVIDLAVEMGYYDPASGKPFSFRMAYDPPNPYSMRVCAARVWSVYRRSAPSLSFSDDYHRGVEGSQDYPLFIKPDNKLTVQDAMGLMRDHFEGTPYDMTLGLDAGPFASPYRFRDLKWKVDEAEYCWERPISTQQAGFVMVSQCRDWLPDPIGGIYWYTPDDCYTTSFQPFYAGISRVPRSYTLGDIERFSWDSAWWVFNFVSNRVYNCYSRIMPEVAEVQKEVEDALFAMQPAVESTALQLHKQDPELAKKYLTTYCVSSAEGLVERWRELGEDILTKHNDGFVRDPGVKSVGVEYPDAWLRRVISENPDQFKLPEWEEDTAP